MVAPGINSKMDEMRSAYGLLNLRQVDDAIEARHQVAIRYREALRDVEGITFWDDMPGVKHNYSYFPIFVDAAKYGMSRDELYFRMKEQGVLLCIVSKNNPADALDVIRNHPHMVLREADFAAMKINWTAKNENLSALARELNLGLDSFVFFDDSAQERTLVRELLLAFLHGG